MTDLSKDRLKSLTDFTLHRRAQKCIAQGYLTNSKRPESLIKGVYPTHLKKGRGCYVWDHNGKKYIDFITGLGTNLLGYANDTINEAVFSALREGNLFSLGSEQEILTAEKLKELFPFVDCFKFLKTGSEATSAAIKIARAYQGVENGSKNLHEMWFQEMSRRIQQRQNKIDGQSVELQNVRESISNDSKNNGNKKASASEILKNLKWPVNGSETFKDTPNKDKEIRERQDILCRAKGFDGWSDRKEFVRSMWRSYNPGASYGLCEATPSEMAMSLSSRTGARWLILSDGYHGHHDSFTSLTAPGVGVPTDLGILPLSGNEDLIGIAAAVILEPIITDFSEKRIEWLRSLRENCTRNGTLLIFDEIITGFRFPKYSFSAYSGITPDLICLGKAMANGFPLAAVGGKHHVMNCSEYFVSSTYSGCIDALVACRKVCEMLQRVYSLDLLWRDGEKFKNDFNSIWPEKIYIEGYPTRGIFKGDVDARNILMQEACFAGILLGTSPWFNFPLVKEASMVIDTLRDILYKIKKNEAKLIGEPPTSPFAEKVRTQ